mgnify:CR=1 FL=1
MSHDLTQVPDIAIDLMSDWDSEELSQFEFMSGGFSNDNYSFCRTAGGRQEKYVLRIPRVKQPFVDRTEEIKVYQAVSNSLGAKLIAFDADSGRMITQWLEGYVLADVPQDRYSDQHLIDYVKSLQSRLPATNRQYDVRELAQLLSPNNNLYIPAVAADVELVPCHNDLNPWNVIVSADGWKTLDWEFFGLNDPLFDLVALHQSLELPDARLSSLAGEFLEQENEQRLVDNLRRFWSREHAWADYQIRAGNDREGIRQQWVLSQEKLANF